MGIITSALNNLLGHGNPTDFAAIAPASEFTIVQLTGKKRKVLLSGRGLPYRPFSLETEQRVEVKWLPGTVKGLATVLGPTEEPTDIKGAWKDKFVSQDPAASGVNNAIQVDGLPIGNIRDAVAAIDAIVREGQEVRVTWDQDIRTGFLVKFRKDWLNAHDLEWSMTFTWISRGEPDFPVVPPGLSVPTITNGLLAKLGDLLAAAQDPKFSLVPEFIKDLQQDLATISDLANSVQALGEALVTAALSPVACVQSIVATCSGIVTRCADFVDMVESRLPGDLNNNVEGISGVVDGVNDGFIGGSAGGGADVAGAEDTVTPSGGSTLGAGAGPAQNAADAAEANAAAAAASQAAIAALNFGTRAETDTQDFSDRLAASLFVKDMVIASNRLRQEAVSVSAQIVQQLNTQLKAIYTARQGDELRGVSRKYFGTQDNWKHLMIFNELTSSLLSAGQVILIPADPEGSIP